MAVFRFSPTVPGNLLMAEVQNGAVLVPTKFVIGTGHMGTGKQPGDITNVVAPLKEFPVSKKTRTPDGYCIFGCVMSNEDVTDAFYLRELALYAKAEYRDAGGNVTSSVPEVCLIYGNAGDTADLYPAYSTSTIVERAMEISSYIGAAAHVDVTLESGIYLSTYDVGIPGGVAPLDDNGLVPDAHLPVITLEALGGVAKTGDTMTGDLDIRKNIPHLLMGPVDTTRTDLFKNASGNTDYGTFLRDISGGKIITAILAAKDMRFYLHIDGVEYPIYSAFRKPTPEELGVSALGHNHLGDTLSPNNLELNVNGGNLDNGGYIDFHFGGSKDDLTSRLVEFQRGKIQIVGELYEHAARVFSANFKPTIDDIEGLSAALVTATVEE